MVKSLKAIYDRSGALDAGLAAIREQFQLARRLPARGRGRGARRLGRPLTGHVDRTNWPFVTLDPVSSTDLDQAFAIGRSGADLYLYYAIADVGAFVAPGGAIDRESWERGVTLYLPDGKVGLYPPSLSEGAASLLPDGPRPSICSPSGSIPTARPTSSAPSAR